MSELKDLIKSFLESKPQSSARQIARELQIDKSEINSCLYTNIRTMFAKIGESPPLWSNSDDTKIALPVAERNAPIVERRTTALKVDKAKKEDFWDLVEKALEEDPET